MRDRNLIGDMWLDLAEMYGKPISKQVLTLMLDSVSDLDPEKVLIALRDWPKHAKQNRHPLPAEIRELVMPKVDDDSIAREVASRICSAIRKFGYTNPEKAREYIGEIGWIVVDRSGGWVPLCENSFEDQMGVFQAQARDLARAQIVMAKAGKLDAPPNFSKLESSRSNGLTSAGEIMKQLKEK